jgi:hypothetical protein
MQTPIMIALNVISRTYLREYKKFMSKHSVDLCKAIKLLLSLFQLRMLFATCRKIKTHAQRPPFTLWQSRIQKFILFLYMLINDSVSK